MEDVRLVAPYQISTTDKDGNHVQTWTDVVVDNVLLERHTTGIDPFTKIDYGTREFPEEHRFDPETGIPVFNRYIAGTRRRIQWPWETVLPEQEDNSEKMAYSSGSNKSLIGKLKTPIETAKSWIKSSRSKDDNEQSTELTEEELAAQRLQAKLDQVNQVPELPRGAPVRLPADHEDDTGRNKAEPSPNTSSFYPTLVYPPFPRQLAPEIQTHAQEVEAAERSEKQDWYANKKEVSAEERTRRKAAKAERLRPKGIPETMKTPLQLRWEVERRQKLEQREKTKVDRNALMIALGAHIDAKKAARIPAKVGSDLD
jgi:large subunit ribosomal protein L24